jgi:hypothetical protein
MSRPPGLPKTGGRARGTPNKPKQIGVLTKPRPIKLTQQDRELIVMAQVMRTPKAVILEAMVKFETLGKGLLAKADNLMKTRGDPKKAAELAEEGYKYIVAAVECATKVAPYIHARLLAVESRGDMTADRPPYVLRAPTVMANGEAWQAAVGAAAIEREAVQVPSGGQPLALLDPRPSLAPPTPERAQVATPMALVADQKSGRISTMMPAGLRLVKAEPAT